MIELVRRLMYPRFEVIAAYPLSPYKVGYIIDKSQANELLADGTEEPEYFRQYPKAFKELEWWEHRTLFEMMQIRFIETTGEGQSRHYVPGIKLTVLQFYYSDLDTVEPKFKCFITKSSQGGIVEIYPNQCKPITKSEKS